MKVNLIVVEVGVRLGRQHPEYNEYRIGALNEGGFYDEDVSIYLDEDLDKALSYAKNYVEQGVDNTYAIVYHGGRVDIDTETLRDLLQSGVLNDLPTITDKKDVIYFAQKGWV